MTQSHPSLPLQRINECLCLLFNSALVTCWFQFLRDYLEKIMVRVLALTFLHFELIGVYDWWLGGASDAGAIYHSTIAAFEQGNTFSLQKNTQKYIFYTDNWAI